MKTIKQFLANESGATGVEYGLLAALVALVIIPAVTPLGTNLKAKFQAVATALQ